MISTLEENSFHDYHSLAQGIKSLPIVPNMTSGEFFAGDRLGYSCFGALVWSIGQRPSWTFLVSRVLEKSTLHAVACWDQVFRTHLKPEHRRIVQWSDGPRQFKSLQKLASCIPYLEKDDVYSFNYEYGCPCHWKGPWDTMFGTISNITKMAAQ